VPVAVPIASNGTAAGTIQDPNGRIAFSFKASKLLSEDWIGGAGFSYDIPIFLIYLCFLQESKLKQGRPRRLKLW